MVKKFWKNFWVSGNEIFSSALILNIQCFGIAMQRKLKNKLFICIHKYIVEGNWYWFNYILCSLLLTLKCMQQWRVGNFCKKQNIYVLLRSKFCTFKLHFIELSKLDKPIFYQYLNWFSNTPICKGFSCNRSKME